MSFENAFAGLNSKKPKNKKPKVKASTVAKAVKRQGFDYFMVLDFEATCEKDDRLYPHEIIEFPVAVVDAKTLAVVHRFHSYVKPVMNPVLTEFCTKLTGISQAQVDDAPVLDEVLKNVDTWLSSLGMFEEGTSFTFATDGPWDFRDFYWDHSVTRQHAVSRHYPYYEKWVDIRMLFGEHTKQRLNVAGMLKHFNMKFEGRPHSGVDDTTNIARILVSMIEKKGIVIAQNGKVKGEVLRGHLSRVSTGDEPPEKIQKFTFLMPIVVGEQFVETTLISTADNKIISTLKIELSTQDHIEAALHDINKWLAAHGAFNEGKQMAIIPADPEGFEKTFWEQASPFTTTSYPYYKSWCDVTDGYARFSAVKLTLGEIVKDLNITAETLVGQVTEVVQYLIKKGIVLGGVWGVGKVTLSNHLARIKKKGVQDEALEYVLATWVEKTTKNVQSAAISVGDKKIVSQHDGDVQSFLEWAAGMSSTPNSILVAGFSKTASCLATCVSPAPLLLTRSIDISKIPTYGAFTMSTSLAETAKSLRLPPTPAPIDTVAAVVVKLLHSNVRLEVNTGC